MQWPLWSSAGRQAKHKKKKVGGLNIVCSDPPAAVTEASERRVVVFRSGGLHHHSFHNPFAMQHTRTALTAVLRASSRASVAPIRTRAIASIHTASTVSAEEKRGFLSRLNPFAKPTSSSVEQTSAAQDAKAAAELNVEIAEEEAPIPRCAIGFVYSLRSQWTSASQD